MKEIVDEAVPEQDNLDIEGDGIGCQRYRADEAVHFAQRLDADLAR